jgi:hypothetical protein
MADATAPDLQFGSNQEFWHTMLKSRQAALNWVKLRLFQIVDWFPRTPGLYHTDHARMERRIASQYATEEDGILFYEPYGKGHMINGGVGSVRFKPITIKGEDCWLCSATSDGVCHSGIPLAIPNHLMREVDLVGGDLYNVVGQVKFIPDFFERHFVHASGVPQIYVLADRVRKQPGTGRETSVEITPMVFFEGGYKRGHGEVKGVTFVRCSSNSLDELDRATDWLQWYVGRYGGKVVTNFDQQRPLFSDAPFSLQNVMSGRVDIDELERYRIEQAYIYIEKAKAIYAEEANMTTIRVEFGDGNTFYGDVIVAEKIKNSFNQADKADAPDELRDLLKELAVAVGKMSESLPKDEAKKVARDLETLTEEAISAEPRRRWWELSIDGLKQAARNVGEIGLPVIRLASAISTILLALQ